METQLKKYMNFLTLGDFILYNMNKDIINIESKGNVESMKYTFIYRMGNTFNNMSINYIDEMECGMEDSIRNHYDGGDAYVFIKQNINEIEIILYDELFKDFKIEAREYTRMDNIREILYT